MTNHISSLPPPACASRFYPSSRTSETTWLSTFHFSPLLLVLVPWHWISSPLIFLLNWLSFSPQVRHHQEAGTGNIRKSAIRDKQGNRSRGRNQDHQEEQNRDRSRSHQDTARGANHELSPASEHHSHLRGWVAPLCRDSTRGSRSVSWLIGLLLGTDWHGPRQKLSVYAFESHPSSILSSLKDLSECKIWIPRIISNKSRRVKGKIFDMSGMAHSGAVIDNQ